MRISPAKRRAALGVATIEVLVAVAIVMMVGTIGVLTFGGTDRAQLREEAAEVSLFLQQARLRALEQGQPMPIILDDGVLRAGAQTFSFSDSMNVKPETAQIVLEPSGGSDGLTISLRLGDETADVALDWLTGRVRIQ